MPRNLFLALLSLILFFSSKELQASPDQLYLKDNLARAEPGDYIVTAQNKTYTLLHIQGKSPSRLTMEEITVPEKKISLKQISWNQWVSAGAPGHTAWVIYDVNLSNAALENYFSFSKNSWYEMPEADNFLSTLLNLRLAKIPESNRKRVGPVSDLPSNDRRPLWQPTMVVDSQPIQGVQFDGWRTSWPKDGSELSGKTIEVYTPQESSRYPSYFPYWLQISGMIGKAKVRIIDSGKGLVSPKTRDPVETEL